MYPPEPGRYPRIRHLSSFRGAVHFQDEIANIFQAKGLYIAHSVASVFSEEIESSECSDLRSAIEKLGERIRAERIGGLDREQVAQAVMDMFHDRHSQSFRWFADLCAVYVAICALGLETRSQAQVEKRIREIDLLLDTDIVLSLLLPGEYNHDAVTRIVASWKRTAGNVLVAPVVLEEAAYHAWMAQREYEKTWRGLADMTDREAGALIQNAFVRSFREEADGRYEANRWERYINMFRGSSEFDYRRIRELLEDGNVYLVSIEEERIKDSISEGVADALVEAIHPETVEREAPQQLRDKADRDGRLIAILRARRERVRELGRTAVVVSSSPRLRDAVRRFRETLGKPEAVLPVSAVAYLLTLMPGVNLSMGALRGVLFDVGFRQKLSGLERIALRAIHSSNEYLLPFARRGQLRRAMRERIGAVAQQRGETVEEVEKGIVRGDDAYLESAAHVVAEALDQITRSKSEQRNETLRREIRKLRRES